MSDNTSVEESKSDGAKVPEESQLVWADSDSTDTTPPAPSNTFGDEQKDGERSNFPIPRSESSIERLLEEKQAAYHDHGRHHFASEKLAIIEGDDPFKYVFEFVDTLQEYALPLITGIFFAMLLANIVPKTYEYYFSGCKTSEKERRLSGGADTCSENHFLLSECDVFGHAWTLHFFANDIVMCFHFALAMKEVTESLLPGGSLNPPSKAMNPIIVTIGCVAGPIIAYFVFLYAFVLFGLFDEEYDRGLGWSELSKGWGVVAATDIILAWLVGRLVFGDGHPAIDFLLLLAVASDGLGIVFIAIFYTDPLYPVRPAYLTVVAGGMGIAYALRKWHFRKELVTHQPWQPYVFVSGVVTWIGLIKARLHPALALAFIVPFMPGPDIKELDHLEEEIEEEIEEDMTRGKNRESLRRRKKSIDEGQLNEDHLVNEADILAYHHAHRGRGISIQAGLFGGLAGHRVDDAFKVKEYDEDGQARMNVSTLDSFEHFWKFYADFGLGFFALTNAGVKLKSIGPMTALIITALVVGKYSGIVLMYKLSKWLGFLPPLGIRTRHIRMIGLLASMGLTVALFVSDVAFTDTRLQGDAKIGSLLSGAMGIVAWGISKFIDFSHEMVDEQAKIQVRLSLNYGP